MTLLISHQSAFMRLSLVLLVLAVEHCWTFTLRPNFHPMVVARDSCLTRRHMGDAINIVDDNDNDNDDEDEDDDEEDEEEPNSYRQRASSEFLTAPPKKEGDLVFQATTNVDWGGALGKLRARVEDVESGKSQDPSQVLFRLMSAQAPNQAINNFVSTASPQVVQAMSGAVGSLLGGLASPASGLDTIVKASGDKVASLCFQLQMTGYLFRNAEYVIALKDLMKLTGGATLEEYKEAFDRLDSNGSGYIEAAEVSELLGDVYDGKTPDFEIETFLNFFDEDGDGKISWDEFQRGLFGMADNVQFARQNSLLNAFALPGGEDDDDILDEMEAQVSGELEIQMEDGRVVKVDAEEYVAALKTEAKALKEALQREKGGIVPGVASADEQLGGIANYIASRRGDVKALTEGISPEIVKTMKLLVDFVFEGGEGGDVQKGKNGPKKEEMEMVIPATALQQLALWQLVLGYRLREAEAKGEYLKLLE
jgi:hypothetical protein